MEKRKTDELIKKLNGLSYEEKKQIYSQVFSLGVFNNRKGNTLDDTMILFSLISLTFIKLKEKDPKINPLKILKKIIGTDVFPLSVLESLSILIEDLSYGCNTASSCGLNNSNQIINKIKEILNTWTPF